jgi:hypothetical protein
MGNTGSNRIASKADTRPAEIAPDTNTFQLFCTN